MAGLGAPGWCALVVRRVLRLLLFNGVVVLRYADRCAVLSEGAHSFPAHSSLTTLATLGCPRISIGRSCTSRRTINHFATDDGHGHGYVLDLLQVYLVRVCVEDHDIPQLTLCESTLQLLLEGEVGAVQRH